jgi:hypothetical protein
LWQRSPERARKTTSSTVDACNAKRAGAGQSRLNSQFAAYHDDGALDFCSVVDWPQKSRRICQKIHIKIKTKSKQPETFEQVRSPHSNIPLLTIRSFPV